MAAVILCLELSRSLAILPVVGVPGVPLADQLTLSKPGEADYADHITTGIPRFSNLPTALIERHRVCCPFVEYQ